MGDALAPWHIILLVVVILVLFGAKRLPGAAKSLGESMHIFKNSVQGHEVDLNNSQSQPSPQATQVNLVPPALTPTPTPPPPAAPAQNRDEQLAALQRQIEDLQRQGQASPAASAGTGQPQAQPQSSQQSF